MNQNHQFEKECQQIEYLTGKTWQEVLGTYTIPELIQLQRAMLIFDLIWPQFFFVLLPWIKKFPALLSGDRTSPKFEQSPLYLQGFRSYLVWKGVLYRKTPDKALFIRGFWFDKIESKYKIAYFQLVTCSSSVGFWFLKQYLSCSNKLIDIKL